MDAYETILSLRAVRHFQDCPLPVDVLERKLPGLPDYFHLVLPYVGIAGEDRHIFKLTLCNE